MADVIVVLLTTLVVFVSSVLLWKWITGRNRLLQEQRAHSRPSKADVRNNRLKKFDTAQSLRKGEQRLSENDTTRGSQVNSAGGGDDEASASATEVKEETSKERETCCDGKAETAEKPDGVYVEKSNILKTKLLSESDQLKSPKPGASRKWVTLSVMDSTEVAVPVTKPITSLEELRAWREGFDEFNISSVALRKASGDLEQRPRTLVCHDMKGGYLEDRFVQGFSSADCYRIYHWQFIDIFVYFSHNFVTIPPPSWTNTAHQHGVKVLGTFITEWNDGAKCCAEIFTDQYSYQRVADQLVCVAKYYGFDGWLVNIENPVRPVQVNYLADFLHYLTSEMHRHIPGALVIWYDSVTYNGELKWQNELNPENRIFFDVSDGIFLNYGWNEINLMTSARGAGQDRRYDVYVGVDVFGRGCFGGGGWNTNKATKVIKSHDLSIALFAPGWVYENFQSSFEVSQNKFWTAIAPDCTIHTLESSLPFVTAFCQGYGNRVFKNGQVVLDKSWTHLGAQQIQCSFTNHIYCLGDQHGIVINSMEHSCKEAYNGGGCLLLGGTTMTTAAASKAVVRLFKTDILLPSTIVISFSTKFEPPESVDVALQLLVDKKPPYIMLCPFNKENVQECEGMDTVDQGLVQRYGVTRSKELSSDRLTLAVGEEQYRVFVPVAGEQHSKLHTLCSGSDATERKASMWCTRYYLLAEKDLKGSRIKEIRLVLMNKSVKAGLPNKDSSTHFKLFLGEVKIMDAVSLRRPLPIVTSLHCRESKIRAQMKGNGMMILSLTLSWSYDSSSGGPWQRFEVYHVATDGSTTLLGLAFAMSFFVSDIAIPRSHKEMKFAVQAVNCAQRRQPLEDCPTITIHWS